MKKMATKFLSFTAAVLILGACSQKSEEPVVNSGGSNGPIVVTKNGMVFQTPQPEQFKQPYCDTIVDIQKVLKDSNADEKNTKKISDLFGKAADIAAKNNESDTAELFRNQGKIILGENIREDTSAQIGSLLRKECGFDLSSQVAPEAQQKLAENAAGGDDENFSLIKISQKYNPGQNSSLNLNEPASPYNQQQKPTAKEQAVLYSLSPPFDAVTQRIINPPVVPQPENYMMYADPVFAYEQALKKYEQQLRIKYQTGSLPPPAENPGKYANGSCGTLYSIAQLYYPGLDDFPALSIPMWRKAASEVGDNTARSNMLTIASFLEKYETFPNNIAQNQITPLTSPMLASMANMQKFSETQCGFQVFPKTLYSSEQVK